MHEANRQRWESDFFSVVEGLDELVAEKDCTMAQLALAWCVRQPGVTSPIIGPRTMEQLVDNLGALDVAITDGDRARIDNLVAPGSNLAPYYEANFGPHPHRW
jgi:aryl-alcohol dehydrogenase-like predicted oxidoreductase